MYGKVKASKDSIYSYINDYDIFRYYIANFKEVGVLFKSELRLDKNPTCCINKYGEKLLYIDFADIESKGLDVFAYIQKKYSCTFYEALDIISADFNLNLLPNTNKPIEKKHSPIIYNKDLDSFKESYRKSIKVKIRPFNKNDKEYWYDRFQITVKTLKKFNVFALEYYLHEGNLRKYSKSLYGYYFGRDLLNMELWKIYYPIGDKLNKWYTNCGNDVVQGYSQLPESGDFLIITKSLKDIMVLSNLDIPAVSPQAENHLIPLEVIQELKTRFKSIYVLFDNDDTGIKSANKYNEIYGLPTFFIPLELEIKDAADVVEYYDYSLLKDIIDANCYY